MDEAREAHASHPTIAVAPTFEAAPRGPGVRRDDGEGVPRPLQIIGTPKVSAIA